jgi:nucleotide-binding universal stress UspA family protein
LACDLLIVTVADRLLAGEVRQLAHTEIRPGDILECLTAQTLKAAEACARRLGVQQIEVRTSWGDVTKSLLDIAASGSAKMIVVGRRGRGQLAGLLLGSASQKLVSLAPCPVVVVP